MILSYFLGAAGVAIGFFTIIFLIAQKQNNNSIVDIFWGLSFVVQVVYGLLFRLLSGETVYWIQLVLSALIALWGLRLFLYIGIRNLKKPEDFRYVDMKKKWGTKNPRLKAYVNVFLTQAAFHFVVALPIHLSMVAQTDVALPILIGSAMLFAIGFLFEAVGDEQLAAFKRQKKAGTATSRILSTGLWKYTRHPNYFGEAVMWWAFGLLVFPTNLGFFALISPIVMTWLLRFVSGVPLLEKKYENDPEFQAYAKKTPIFFPWFPKK